MKTTMTIIAIATLAAGLGATTYAPPQNREVQSSNGKFTLHVNARSNIHRITGGFAEGEQPWEFKHDTSRHSFFVSDDGMAAAVVNWAWCGGLGLELDSPALAIYGRGGLARSYTYNELSKPRERKPDEIGPIGDFWRVWRREATIKGNVLTLEVEGGNPRVIDLRNPGDMPPIEPDLAGRRKVPDTWQPYGPGQFELKKGLHLYYSKGTIIVDIDEGVTIEGHHPENYLLLQLERVENAPKILAGIRSETQARDLCEILITGGIIDDAESYRSLLKVHRAEGCEQLVADAELNFERVAKTVEGGFQVEFTAFHLPRTMGGQSIVARYKFLVGEDASVRVESTPYIKGLDLNWQTMMLETKEAKAAEARSLARVEEFVSDCLKCCTSKLPTPPGSLE